MDKQLKKEMIAEFRVLGQRKTLNVIGVSSLLLVAILGIAIVSCESQVPQEHGLYVKTQDGWMVPSLLQGQALSRDFAEMAFAVSVSSPLEVVFIGNRAPNTITCKMSSKGRVEDVSLSWKSIRPKSWVAQIPWSTSGYVALFVEGKTLLVALPGANQDDLIRPNVDVYAANLWGKGDKFQALWALDEALIKKVPESKAAKKLLNQYRKALEDPWIIVKNHTIPLGTPRKTIETWFPEIEAKGDNKLYLFRQKVETPIEELELGHYFTFDEQDMLIKATDYVTPKPSNQDFPIAESNRTHVLLKRLYGKPKDGPDERGGDCGSTTKIYTTPKGMVEVCETLCFPYYGTVDITISRNKNEKGVAHDDHVVNNTHIGKSPPKDPAKARLYYHKACEGGDAEGCNKLGVLWSNGNGGPKDKAKARLYYHKACEGGDAEGCNKLGVFWSDGLGGPKDNTKSRSLYKKACEGGDAMGCNNLGTMWAHGLGGPKDKAKARSLYKKTCEGGNFIGCELLGIVGDNGESGTKNKTNIVNNTHFVQSEFQSMKMAESYCMKDIGDGVKFDKHLGKNLLLGKAMPRTCGMMNIYVIQNLGTGYLIAQVQSNRKPRFWIDARAVDTMIILENKWFAGIFGVVGERPYQKANGTHGVLPELKTYWMEHPLRKYGGKQFEKLPKLADPSIYFELTIPKASEIGSLANAIQTCAKATEKNFVDDSSFVAHINTSIIRIGACGSMYVKIVQRLGNGFVLGKNAGASPYYWIDVRSINNSMLQEGVGYGMALGVEGQHTYTTSLGGPSTVLKLRAYWVGAHKELYE